MFRNVFLKTLFDMRTSLFWWTVGMFAFSLLLMAFYPSIEESAEELQNFMDNMPDFILAMAGGDDLDLTSLEGFLSVRVGGTYPILTLAFAISYGVSLIAGEEESRTFDLLLATPVPRWRVVIDKFAALVVFTVVVLVGCYLGLIVGAILVDAGNVNEGRLFAGILNLAPLTLFFGALGLFLAGVQRRRGLAMGLVVGFAATTYIIDTLSTITDVPLWMQRLSPWHYYQVEALREGVKLGDVGLLLGLTALFVGLAMWGFERRDVGV